MTFTLHDWYLQGQPLPKPLCVLGISGIYHFEAFVENHKDIPAYQQLMDNAFPDKSLWERASPYASRLPGLANWEHAETIVIAHSSEDELVELSQSKINMMERARMTENGKEKVHYQEITGSHDEVWESGHRLADLISKSLKLAKL